MKKFTRLLIIFTAPFILFGVLVAIVDPYNFLYSSNYINNKIKLKCLERTNESIPRGVLVWKSIEFKRHPVQSVLIGDSRIFDFDENYFSEKLGQKIYNFGIPGGNCLSTIQIFWYTAKQTKLDTAILQLDFSTYNTFVNYNLFDHYKNINSNPLNYFFRSEYIFDSFAILYYAATGNEDFVKRSYKDKSNWNNVIYLTTPRYESYGYPEKYYSELKKISVYCRNNHIKLYFLILPDYAESIKLLTYFNLHEEYKLFISDISGFGELLDLNSNTEFSRQKENYRDYFHINPSKAHLVIDMVAQKIKP